MDHPRVLFCAIRHQTLTRIPLTPRIPHKDRLYTTNYHSAAPPRYILHPSNDIVRPEEGRHEQRDWSQSVHRHAICINQPKHYHP